MLDISDGANIYTSDVLTGIDWILENQETYNIAAINLSLGASSFADPCNTYNAFQTAFDAAREAGIVVVAAAGNDADSSGIAFPACTPGAISVGAVYDDITTNLDWGICEDPTTTADQITCFSNSAYYLSIFAPGAMITAGGATMGGTSQATPHVAGAVALIRQKFPDASTAEIEHQLLQSNYQLTDPRNGLIFPRLDLTSALDISETPDEEETPSVLIPMIPFPLEILSLLSIVVVAAYTHAFREQNANRS